MMKKYLLLVSAIILSINAYANAFVNIQTAPGKTFTDYKSDLNIGPNSMSITLHQYTVNSNGHDLLLKYYIEDKENSCYCQIDAEHWHEADSSHPPLLLQSGNDNWAVLKIEGPLYVPHEVFHRDRTVDTTLKAAC